MKYNATPPAAREFGTSLADCNEIEKLRAIAEKLWSILDDIDTLSDMMKPSDLGGYIAFYTGTMKRCEKRGKILESDGYSLYLPNANVDLPDTAAQDSASKSNSPAVSG